MSFNCGLSYVKISASVTVSEKWKASVSAQNFAIALNDAPVKDTLASVEDRFHGIFPSETDLNGGKVVSTVRNKKRSRSVLTKKEHMTLQQLKKDITKADKGITSPQS